MCSELVQFKISYDRYCYNRDLLSYLIGSDNGDI